MHSLINWAVSRARMVLAFVFLTVAAGLLAYSTLPNEGEPQIDIPFLYVSVALPGAGASDVEELMIKPLERELKSSSGLKKMTSYATEGHAGVLLRFDFGWDKDVTVADVRQKLDRAEPDLPDDALKPQVFEISTSEVPVIVVSLSGQAPERTMVRLAKDLQQKLEAIGSVSEANMAGHRDEIVEVVVDPLKLDRTGVAAEALINVVRRNNQLIAAGAVSDGNGRFSISVPGTLDSAERIKSIVVKSEGDRTVTIGDIAELRPTFEERESFARFDGQPAIALSIKKRAGESMIETVAEVRRVAAEVRAAWPPSLKDAVQLNFSFDRSKEAARMASQLQNSVLTAVCLVMLVVFSALGLRSALLVGFAVPTSFLLTFAIFGAFGMALNTMVLFGLILAVGLLVDGAIVVAEYADRRVREGAEATAAYAEAARRMAWPVASSTATTLCAFLPMLFWPGGPGEWMGLLPVTMITILSASLLVALIYLPVIGGVIGAAAARVGRGLRAIVGAQQKTASAPIAPEDRPLGRTLFGRITGRIVRNTGLAALAIMLAVGALFASFSIYGAYNNGGEFFTKTVAERGTIRVRARGNLSAEEKDRILRSVEDLVNRTKGVAAAFSSAGATGAFGGGGGPADTIGAIQFEIAPWEELQKLDPPQNGDMVIAEILKRTAFLPGVIVEAQKEQPGPNQGKPVQIEVSALTPELLEQAITTIRQKFETDPQLFDIDDSRPLPGVEWRLELDQQRAGRFGADVVSLGAATVLATRGYTLDTITPSGATDEIDVVARFPKDSRGLSTLETLRIQTAGGLAPITNFVTLRPTALVGEIVRQDGRLFQTVAARVVEGVNVNEKIAEIGGWLTETAAADPIKWTGVTAVFGGDQEAQEETQAFLGPAFAAALGLMFIILLAQFNSFYDSLLVLSAVIMSIGGVLIGLVVMQQPFSAILTGVGIVSLAGIVVNNNIVLIDTYHDYRRRMDPIVAIAKTVEDRLRPVLLTTLTTIAGLVPMMFAASIDFDNATFVAGQPSALIWVPVATAVVWGLAFSTLLTLVVTPSALALRVLLARRVGRGVERIARWRRGPGGRSEDATPAE